MPKRRILIVDDEPVIADSLSEMLEGWGYETAVASDGRAGLALVEEYLPTVVVSDVYMPNLDGFGLLRELRELHPEKRNYFSSQMPMTETAIDTGFTRDLYVSLGEPLDPQGSAWSVRVYYKPFVMWIWGGCLLMALGGAVAAADRRYRLKQRSAAAVVQQGAAA